MTGSAPARTPTPLPLHGVPIGLSAAALDSLVDRVRRLLTRRPRVLIGITGPPGAGKSTLAERLTTALTAAEVPTAWVPMDGFHLADAELDRLDRRGRKGAIDTFDGHGYLALLQRLASGPDHVVYAPTFDRALEQPVAGAIAVQPDVAVVLTEGNYLLDEQAPWDLVGAVLTEVWFCEVPDDTRRARLTARHVEFGKSPEAAERWVADVDEPNAALINRRRPHADLVVPC
jgi:pantothenate kinase